MQVINVKIFTYIMSYVCFFRFKTTVEKRMRRKLFMFILALCVCALYQFWIITGNFQNKMAAQTSLSPEECRKKWLESRVFLLPETEHNFDYIDTTNYESYKDLTCGALLYGNIDEDDIYAKAQKYMAEIKMEAETNIKEDYFDSLIQNVGCNYFEVMQGYHVTPVSQEEAEFPIAFNILMHKDVLQFELLLRSIYRPQNSYCVPH